MSVFTTVTPEQLEPWLRRYAIGFLLELRGIAEGIENTNYFITTSRGRYVLTLFERLPAEQLPFYLDLMAHLSAHGIPCPAPVPDRDNALFGILNGKPACIVSRLSGAPVMQPSARHCAQLGTVLADMHIAAKTYSGTLENPRGAAWWQEAAARVMDFLDGSQRQLLHSELEVQSGSDSSALPRAPVHADLFRDNVLWDAPGGKEGLSGIIDFYFAGVDSLLFDIAVTVNDWCVDAMGALEPERCTALLEAYRRSREFTQAERMAWPLMLRAAALRFWLSRLYDFYLPRPGALTHAHDPGRFQRILELRRSSFFELPG
jgi:homoserine kinase type II